MQAIASRQEIRQGAVGLCRRALTIRIGRHGLLVLLLVLGVARFAALLQAQGRSRSVTSTLVVRVEQAGVLEQQSDRVVVKVRLNPGVAVNLWAGESCTSPAAESYIIAASGVYTFPVNQLSPALPPQGGAAVCMQSSDGALARSLLLAGGTSPKEAGETARPLRLVWSAHVSIPAAPGVLPKNASSLGRRSGL